MTDSMPLPADASRRTFPFAVSSVTECRAVITAECEQHGAEAAATELANLVVGELVMNALRHGEPCSENTVEIAWAFVDPTTLRFSVRDCGRVTELHAEMPPATAFGGRGLGIVERVCRAWTYETSNGTLVTADIPAPRAVDALAR